MRYRIKLDSLGGARLALLQYKISGPQGEGDTDPEPIKEGFTSINPISGHTDIPENELTEMLV